MKFTLSWLKEFLETDATLEQVSETLTSIGLEVEEIVDNAAALAPFKVARIEQAAPHPDADRLQVCQVNTGDEVLQIVCGAPNARAGIYVALAPVGAVIPANGMKIIASEIRGVKSNGMLCSASELGLGQDSDGIIELPEGAEIGTAAAPVLGADDPVIEIAITPNRGDCLGVYGIARDLAAAGLGTLKPLDVPAIDHGAESGMSIAIEEDEAALFIGCVVKDVKNGQSPDWLKRRLESIGQKSISRLVDITNYLTFAYGRPAHLYDLSKLKGDLTMRYAKEGEKFKALDEKEYVLSSEDVVIADEAGIVALGGIIGGLESGVSDATTDILLEIAVFDPVKIAKTGRRLGILSDARYRFERHVPKGFARDGAALALGLIQQLCGGAAASLVVAGEDKEAPRRLSFPLHDIVRMLGVDVPKAEVTAILQRLGFEVKDAGDALDLAIPYWRPDVAIAEDIVEEVARIHGFEALPETMLPAVSLPRGGAKMSRESVLRRVAAMRGISEVISFSFMNSKIAKLFDMRADVRLANPISAELDVLRPSIVPNLLQMAARNLARGANAARLAEIGPVFFGAKPTQQATQMALLRVGQHVAEHVQGKAEKPDVFHARGDAEAVLVALGVSVDSLRVDAEAAPEYYHPGRSAALVQGKQVLAYFGELHPSILQEMDVKAAAMAVEILLDNVPAKRKKGTTRPAYQPSSLQPVTRDFAFVVKADMAAEDVLLAVKKADRKLLSDVQLFDVYQGKGLAEDEKSLALRVTLQPRNETLDETALEAVSAAIISNVEKLTGGRLRA